jgi:WD40-like Beta Propeller Repeat
MRPIPLGRRQVLIGAAAAAALIPRYAASAASGIVDLIPRRLLFAHPDRASVNISPDGKRIAFLAPIGGVLNLWVGPIDDVGKTRPVTRVTDRSLSSAIVWLHDNRHIVFFREQGGDENWQAHRVDLETGDIRALTPSPDVKSYVQEISHHFPSELLIGHNARDKRFFDLYRVDVATDESRLVELNDRFVWHVTDSRFRVRFGVLFPDNGDVEYLQRNAGGEWELWSRVEMADAAMSRIIGLSDDGRTVYWRDSRDRDKAAIVAQDLDTGTRRVIAEGAQADVMRTQHDPRTGARSRRPRPPRVRAGTSSMRRLPPTSNTWRRSRPAT